MDEFKLNSVLSQIRKESRSVRNRLQSIKYDWEWVNEVYKAYSRPLIPNERCGLWYVNPTMTTESCYFKSTDGHITQWSFSTRRLNFHLLDLIISNNGIIIVDSTRRGKRMPDALSKTIPIWCATLNYIMFGEYETNWAFLPKQVLSESEQDSIIKLIPSFANNLVNQLKIITKDQLLEKFKGKHLRPIWVYPGMSLPFETPEFEEFHPIICCVASQKAQDGTIKMNGFTYVQGAADDHELWAEKLTAQLFWENFNTLTDLDKSDTELLEIIDTLKPSQSDLKHNIVDLVTLTDKISIGKVKGDVKIEDITDFNTVVVLSNDFKIIPNEIKGKTLLHYSIPSNKKGSNELRKHLNEIITNINTNWDTQTCLIACDTGIDLSIGVALTILCLHYNPQWIEQTDNLITKDVIKRHLARILSLKKANPSRATLQSVNSFLM